jgi:hypothetical protein
MNRSYHLPLALVAAASLLTALPVLGYERYSGTNTCVQCHDGFVDGFGAPLHDAHNDFINGCSTCHGSTGDNPFIEKCAACHIPGPLWNAHNGAPADGMGFTCATCHEYAANDALSWGETKAFFR